MIWDTSDTLAMAKTYCPGCLGLGMRAHGRGASEQSVPCECVLRAIFRACYSQFRQCATEKHGPGIAIVRQMGRSYHCRPRDEYVADFCLVSKRSLAKSEWDLFNLHYLSGMQYRACMAKLGIDKHEFFRRAQAIQQRLGRVFSELQPYPLWPTADYMGKLAAA